MLNKGSLIHLQMSPFHPWNGIMTHVKDFVAANKFSQENALSVDYVFSTKHTIRDDGFYDLEMSVASDKDISDGGFAATYKQLVSDFFFKDLYLPEEISFIGGSLEVYGDTATVMFDGDHIHSFESSDLSANLAGKMIVFTVTMPDVLKRIDEAAPDRVGGVMIMHTHNAPKIGEALGRFSRMASHSVNINVKKYGATTIQTSMRVTVTRKPGAPIS